MREKLKKLCNLLTQRFEAWSNRCRPAGGPAANFCSNDQIVRKDNVEENAQNQSAGTENASEAAQNQTAAPAAKKLAPSQPVSSCCCSRRCCNRSSRRGLGLLWWAILLLVAVYFVPDLPERMPTLYGFVDLTISFCEWVVKVALGTLRALFTWNLFEFWGEVFQSFKEGWQVFVEFLSGTSL